MALTIKRPKQDEEVVELPEGEVADVEGPEDEVEEEGVETPEQKAHRLEVENAELRGRNSVLDKNKPAAADQRAALQNAKTNVFTDANNLSDEDFEGRYKMSKSVAMSSVLEQENRFTAQETKRLNAEARAEAQLSAELGAEFYRYKDKINLDDLSEEARQDPTRLARFMKTQLKALMTKVPKKSAVSDRSKVVTDFDAPQPAAAAKAKEPLKKSDEIAEEDRELARLMGLDKESDRVRFSSDVVEMDMGGGYVFRDAKKGFEKVEPAVAAKA
jgi:hypothetical protein